MYPALRLLYFPRGRILYRLADKWLIRVADQLILRDGAGQIVKREGAFPLLAPAFDQRLCMGVPDADMPQHDLPVVGDMHKGCILRPLPERKIEVFKRHLHRGLRIAVGGEGHPDVFGPDVLKADVQQRPVVLPCFVAGIVEMQKPVGAVDLAIADRDIGAGVRDDGGVIGVVGENAEHIIPSVLLHGGGIVGQHTAGLFLLRQRAAEEVFGRRKNAAVGDKHICAAKAEG